MATQSLQQWLQLAIRACPACECPAHLLVTKDAKLRRGLLSSWRMSCTIEEYIRITSFLFFCFFNGKLSFKEQLFNCCLVLHDTAISDVVSATQLAQEKTRHGPSLQAAALFCS